MVQGGAGASSPYPQRVREREGANLHDQERKGANPYDQERVNGHGQKRERVNDHGYKRERTYGLGQREREPMVLARERESRIPTTKSERDSRWP